MITSEGGPRPAAVAFRISVVWLLMTVAWVAIGIFQNHLPQTLSPALRRGVVAIAAGLAGVLIVLAACRQLDHRSLGSLGATPLRSAVGPFLFGAGLWGALASAGFVVGVAAGWFTLTFRVPTWQLVGALLFQTAAVFLHEALPEELAFRGYIQTNISDALGQASAVVGQAVIFMGWGLAIVGLQQLAGGAEGLWTITADRIILLLTFGLTLGLLRVWIDSLWASIGFHLAFQATMQLLWVDRFVVFSIPSSGGLASAQLMIWFFTIVLGGLVACAGSIWSRNSHAMGPPRRSQSPGRSPPGSAKP